MDEPAQCHPSMNPADEALVRVAYGSHGLVETLAGEHRDCRFRRNVGRPCCGDHVLVRADGGDAWVVDEILARRNEFMKADARGRPQVVAANLDRVLVVVAPRPMPSRDLLDRYLVAVHSLGIEPVIVLNKAELMADTDIDTDHALAAIDDYIRLGYTVVRTSCKQSPGVTPLAELVQAGTSILVGQSGVGKSSLAHQLLPDIDIQTGALSTTTGKGTHTTTTTILYTLPGGGRLIDSPGVWEYGLWTLDDADIAAGYPEFRPWLGECRFNNCRHASEPGCAIKAAVANGEITARRYAAYTRLLEQNGGQ
ncbi:ribosome small subunit-dependent GTPase A [Marinihelvus fidelis]|uniref:Small ribosomal subunit biogenesis GTPase RsgA n=1 Tax=Marinihelvus fidelis TaxID=2613842 RepID=A0A5N0TDU4_9GAMM|nr:ribosome small subunit-dependent GTPase A [Marinihelvus fidelis]KAA9133185.1 ribosome small subunit-dependent GTPase A [Marinihelvus fidelis]